MAKSYDHRLRELVWETKDIELAVRLGVPASTARSWLRRGTRQVVSCSIFDSDERQLQARVLQLEQQVVRLIAIMRPLILLVQLGGGRLDAKRLPDAEDKACILAVIAKVAAVLPLAQPLHVVGLKRERYWAWCRKETIAENAA